MEAINIYLLVIIVEAVNDDERSMELWSNFEMTEDKLIEDTMGELRTQHALAEPQSMISRFDEWQCMSR